MKCPVDGTTLTMADRAGVEIDYCPQCRGVWLDRGELDKILERAGREAAGERPAPPREERRDDRRDAAFRPAPERRDDRPRYDDDDHRYRDDKRHYKRKESWWSDIFDF